MLKGIRLLSQDVLLQRGDEVGDGIVPFEHEKRTHVFPGFGHRISRMPQHPSTPDQDPAT